MRTSLDVAPLLRVTQQSAKETIGEYRALRSCVPTCFYMVAKYREYLDAEQTLGDFLLSLDWEGNFDDQRGWSRPGLSRQLRKTYGIPIVSWRTAAANEVPTDEQLGRMVSSGYVESGREIDYFLKRVSHHLLSEVVSVETPVVTSMLPGFGANKRNHAVILEGWDTGRDLVEVIDPDMRSPISIETGARFQEYLSPSGASTIILPAA